MWEIFASKRKFSENNGHFFFRQIFPHINHKLVKINCILQRKKCLHHHYPNRCRRRFLLTRKSYRSLNSNREEQRKISSFPDLRGSWRVMWTIECHTLRKWSTSLLLGMSRYRFLRLHYCEVLLNISVFFIRRKSAFEILKCGL